MFEVCLDTVVRQFNHGSAKPVIPVHTGLWSELVKSLRIFQHLHFLLWNSLFALHLYRLWCQGCNAEQEFWNLTDSEWWSLMFTLDKPPAQNPDSGFSPHHLLFNESHNGQFRQKAWVRPAKPLLLSCGELGIVLRQTSKKLQNKSFNLLPKKN